MADDGIVLERFWPPALAPRGWRSHLGGWPNLPPEIAWPRVTFADGASASLDFLAQIDLACLPDTRARGLPPREGVLYFFAVSNAILPLRDTGAGAWRVIFLPRAAAASPPRAPPPDCGWGLADLDHARSIATNFRRTDGPPGELHPYCPVRAIPAAAIAADKDEAPRPARFKYDGAFLPLRVEDAGLQLNFARNAFFENIIPFPEYLDYWRERARSGIAYMAKRRARPGARPYSSRPWQTLMLSANGPRAVAGQYESWRARAAAEAERLAALGRSATLSPAQRVRVVELFEQASALRESISGDRLLGFWPAHAASLSLATLLAHDPDLALRAPEEVAAAAPGSTPPHRMLGAGRAVQGGTMTGPEPILLLQLESDGAGPRFEWWDGGNLTFWMNAGDAAAGAFDQVVAEIEGH